MRYWLEFISARLPMYRIILLSLTAVWFAALLASLTGQLAFSPLSMIASAGVLTLVSYVSNRLFGLIVRIRPHWESAIITGLILFFIMSPQDSLPGLGALAVTAVIAMASKYILAYKGRHIYNPAAVGALVATVLGVAHATWWVATPILFPVTVLGAFLILYKTRRLAMGGAFLAIAGVLTVATSLWYGASLATSIVSLLSWPLLFFAGFMLSEPLTLPPRQKQQMALAGLTGSLFGLAPVFNLSPEATLLIGNVFAFAFRIRGSVRLEFIKSRQLTPTAIELVFRPHRELPFEAGQYVELNLPHGHADIRGTRRMFSIASAPGADEVHFGIKTYDPGSSFKQSLVNLQPGTQLTATTVAGDFLLPTNLHAPILYVAGGIGITPFISHFEWMAHQKQQRDIVLMYAVTSVAELAYIDRLRKLPIRLIVVVPEGKVKGAEVVHERFVTAQILRQTVPDITKRTVYISGPPLMVQVVTASAKQLKARHIKLDYFTGY